MKIVNLTNEIDGEQLNLPINNLYIIQNLIFITPVANFVVVRALSKEVPLGNQR